MNFMKGVTIKNIETGEYIEFKDRTMLTAYVSKLYKEDKETDSIKINRIRNYSDAIYYIKNHCKIIEII